MQLQTEKIRLEILDSISRVKDLVAVTSDAALQKRPAEGAWSAAECLEHLSLSVENYVRRIRRTLETAKTRPPRKTESFSLVGRLFLWRMEPPVRMKRRSPRSSRPETVLPTGKQLYARFDETHRALIALLEETDRFDRTALKMPSPLSKYLKISLLDAFALFAAHDRRHLWQAERAARS